MSIDGVASSKGGAGRLPDRVAVIGGGRWARVLTQVLSTSLPPAIQIQVHSRHNAASMAEWISARALGDRVRASAERPRFDPTESSAVIVANAARDHESTVEWALLAGVPVLVEKPVSLSAGASLHLADLAARLNVRLAAAHVFLYARYIESLRDLVVQSGGPRAIRIDWADPPGESRYGEQKNYDPGLPVFADCLPHVLSIAGTLTGNASRHCEKLAFSRGGAQLDLDVRLGDVPCRIKLARNAGRRERFIEVDTAKDQLKLDFSVEPGTIDCGGARANADPEWDTGMRPVARMLSAFLGWAAGGEFDNRLSIGIGVEASRTIEQAAVMYQQAQMPWLIAKLESKASAVDEDLAYALGEVLQADGPIEKHALERNAENVRRRFTNPDFPGWPAVLGESRDPAAVLRSLAVA